MANPELMTGLGAAAAIFFCSAGACIGSVPGGLFAQRCNDGCKCFVPIMQAGVLAIYGIIIGVILAGKITDNKTMTEAEGYKHLSAGLAVGLACLASGMGMGSFVDKYMNMPHGSLSVAPVSETTRPLIPSSSTAAPPAPKATTKFILSMIFLESIGLYGLIVALFLAGK